MKYESTITVPAKSAPGVTLRLNRMSFARRMELMERIRDLGARAESLGATDEVLQNMDATLLALEVDRAYVLWGVREIMGLEVDGVPATPQSLAEAGPEALFREALTAVRGICGLAGARGANGG
jgi:hypothetical protein